MKDASDRKDTQTDCGKWKWKRKAGDNGRFAVRALPIDYFNKYSCQWENVEPLENGSQSNLNRAKREINKIIKRKQRENDKRQAKPKTTQKGSSVVSRQDRQTSRRTERQTKFHERICQKVKSAIWCNLTWLAKTREQKNKTKGYLKGLSNPQVQVAHNALMMSKWVFSKYYEFHL